MRIERLSQDKIRIFLTFDDLLERGIQKDDMWKEIPKVHELFSDMMEQAYSEVGFDASGPLAVEVFQLPAQGMVIIVTRGSFRKRNKPYDDEYEEIDEDEVFEMEVTMEQSDIISYAFQDFEDLLRMAKIVNPHLIDGGTLFSYQGKWIIQIDSVDLEESRYLTIISILSEFGEVVSVTPAVLEEYGKTVIADDAIKVLCSHFN